jgi:hypothetical protein
MKSFLKVALTVLIALALQETVAAQTTTADGSLPGGVDNGSRAVALSDPFVKKNRDSLKSVKLDPVIFLRLAEQVEKAQEKKSTSNDEVFLTASGTKLDAKGQVLAAYLFAQQQNLRGSQIVAQMKKGMSLSDAAEASLKNKSEEKEAKSESAKNAIASVIAKAREALKATANTIQ